MPIGDLYEKPGYLIRRLRQISAAIFVDEVAPFNVTSHQYTTLKALADAPSLEQTELCERLRLDAATMAALLARLEEKGLVRRVAPNTDRRRRRVSLTPRGRRLLPTLEEPNERVQERILAPLAPADRIAFARMLTKLVAAHERALDDEVAS
jgi:DNA-binding MarR family transcriptional regulator